MRRNKSHLADVTKVNGDTLVVTVNVMLCKFRLYWHCQ